MIGHYETTSNRLIQINKLSEESGIEKRRLYDFMNVLSAFYICVKTGTHTYQWNGLKILNEQLVKLGRDIEAASYTTRMEELFLLPESPNIKLMTQKVVQYFLFYGFKTISLKELALAMAMTPESTKPVLRRLYLVAYFLERIDIIQHSTKIGEYTFTKNPVEIMLHAHEAMLKNLEFPMESVVYQMNRITEIYITGLMRAREEKYNKLMNLKMQPALSQFSTVPQGYIPINCQKCVYI